MNKIGMFPIGEWSSQRAGILAMKVQVFLSLSFPSSLIILQFSAHYTPTGLLLARLLLTSELLILNSEVPYLVP